MNYPPTWDDEENYFPGIAPSCSTPNLSNKKQQMKRTMPTPTLAITNGPPGGNKKKLVELSGAVKELRTASEILSQPEVEDSEATTFGMYVGKCISNFPPLQSALAQQEIQAVLTKYKLSLIENSSYASQIF